MAVWDIWHRRIGTVERVDDQSFDLRSRGTTIRVRSDALYWVGTSVATLICNESRLGAYRVEMSGAA